MADFCKDCSIYNFGEDFGDLANLLPAEKYTATMGARALCEDCGPVVVDINGKRMLLSDEQPRIAPDTNSGVINNDKDVLPRP